MGVIGSGVWLRCGQIALYVGWGWVVICRMWVGAMFTVAKSAVGGVIFRLDVDDFFMCGSKTGQSTCLLV